MSRTPSRGGSSARDKAEFARAYAEGRVIQQEDWRQCRDCGKTGTHVHDGPHRPSLSNDLLNTPFNLDELIDEVLADQSERLKEVADEGE